MKKVGLDDPRRVLQILDRGQQFVPPQKLYETVATTSRPEDAPARIDTTSSPEDAYACIRTIEYELDMASTQCALNPEKMFIPHGKLLEVLTPERVRMVVESLECFSKHSDKAKIAGNIHFGSNNPPKPPCLKLLAALIFIERPEDIAKHMEDGVDDSCFPLSYNGSGANQSISCKRHGQSHSTMNKEYRLIVRENLSRVSYRLSAPFIKWREKLHSHYILDSSDVLPVNECYNARSRGYSEVQKVKLHKSHYDFGGQGVRWCSPMDSVVSLFNG